MSNDIKKPTLPGFEPGIFWSVVRRVIHCATRPLLCILSPAPKSFNRYIFSRGARRLIKAISRYLLEKRHRRGSNPWSSVYETDALPLGHCASCDLVNSRWFKPNFNHHDTIWGISRDKDGSTNNKTSLREKWEMKKNLAAVGFEPTPPKRLVP